MTIFPGGRETTDETTETSPGSDASDEERGGEE
jgi:hypothetical protein